MGKREWDYELTTKITFTESDSKNVESPQYSNSAGLLVLRTVVGPRNLPRSAKSCDIDKKARNPMKFTKICT